MQYVLDFGVPSPLAIVHDRLKAHYGIPLLGPRFSPVSMLIMAMLGSRTRDAVSLKAFHNLRMTFADWNALAHASSEQVYPCICDVTFAKTYSKYIPEALLEIIQKQGELNLDFLGKMTVEQAQAWLQNLRGVGPKISACVLNFSVLHMRALVVDTHYLRFAERYHGIGPRMKSTRVTRAILRQVPNSWLAIDVEQHHVLVKRLAQEICIAGSHPQCCRCPLMDTCIFGKQ